MTYIYHHHKYLQVFYPNVLMIICIFFRGLTFHTSKCLSWTLAWTLSCVSFWSSYGCVLIKLISKCNFCYFCSFRCTFIRNRLVFHLTPAVVPTWGSWDSVCKWFNDLLYIHRWQYIYIGWYIQINSWYVFFIFL